MEDCIKARQVVIVDDEGRSRLTLGVDEHGRASFVLTDTRGRSRAAIAVGEPDESGNVETTFKLTTGDAGPTAVMAAKSDGSVGVRLMRTDGHPLAILEIEAGGDSRPSLILCDPTERIPFDEEGKLRWGPEALVYLTVTEDPVAYLQFVDPAGAPRERYP